MDHVICPKCGKELPAGARFCLACGAEIPAAVVCPRCGRELPSEAKFCTYCGAAIGTAGISPGPSTKEIQEAVEFKRSNLAIRAAGALLMGAILLMALVVILSSRGKTQSEDPLPPVIPPASSSVAPEQMALEEPDAPWAGNVLRNDVPDSRILEPDEYPVFGSEYTRDQIASITFLDSLGSQGDRAWDVSRAGDGSVIAWVEPSGELFDLYIGGEGGVAAPEDCTFLFGNYNNVRSIRVGDALHTENTTNMRHMFSGCKVLTEVDVGGFDTAQVTDMQAMFVGCWRLKKLDVGGWDTSRVEDMSFLFYCCYDLAELDPGSWDTSRVTDMQDVFAFCQNLTALDLGGWSTDAAQYMDAMFFNCKELRLLNADGWNTASASKQDMFEGCGRLDASVTRSLLAGGVPAENPGTPGDTTAQTPPSSGTAAAGSGTTLPDPSDFLHGKLKHRERDISGGLEVHFYFDKTSKSAAYEYVDLLSGKSVDLKLRQEFTDRSSDNGSLSVYYVYNYGGSGSVDSISLTTTHKKQNFEAPVIVNVVEFGGTSYVSSNWLYLTIYCSNDFSFADSGDRSTDSVFEDFYNKYDGDTAFLGPVGTGFKYGSSSGGSSSNYEYDISAPGSLGNKVDCSFCGGDGRRDCMVCGGDGKVKRYESGGGVHGVGPGEWVWKDCTSCDGNGWKKCTACGGDGKV